MRVVSGKVHETIAVPECDVSVTVMGIENRTVRLEISAPPHSIVQQKRKPDNIVNPLPVAMADTLDLIAAEITDGAYQAALRCRPASCWIDLELHLWHSLSSTVKTNLHWQDRTPHPIEQSVTPK